MIAAIELLTQMHRENRRALPRHEQRAERAIRVDDLGDQPNDRLAPARLNV
jgi:hypothetical protein